MALHKALVLFKLNSQFKMAPDSGLAVVAHKTLLAIGVKGTRFSCLNRTFYLSKPYHIDSAGLCAQADGSYWVRFSALMDGAGTGMPSKSNALAWIDVGRVVTVIS